MKGDSSRPRFTDNGDGTVTDNETGLIWLRDVGCLPVSDWSQAQQACAALKSGDCGLSDGSQPGDWRMPSIGELIGLLDYRFLPALSNTAGSAPWRQGDPFENVSLDDLYWSATAAAQAPTALAWGGAFNNGNIYNDFQSSPYHPWPVRGPVAAPVPQRFTINGDGTVTDNQTRLVWLQNANAFGLLRWSDAIKSVGSLASGQHGLEDESKPGDWRLPTMKELLNLLDFRYAGPVVSNTAGTLPATQGDPFDNIVISNLYWSATTYTQHDDIAWVALLNSGNMSTTAKIGFYYIWPVCDKS